MELIKLNATDSTNSFLRELVKAKSVKTPTIVVTDNQLAGRGQRNSNWHFEKGKSLAMSIYYEPKQLNIQDQFYLSMLVSLSVQKVLINYGVPKVSVKWPNDILSRSKKMVGILIENTIKQEQIASSIIGIGLNVNTMPIEALPRLGSMYTQTQNTFAIDEVVTAILEDLLPKMKALSKSDFIQLKAAYENNLFRKDKVSSFKDTNNQLFSGIIRGVNEYGQLKVETSMTTKHQLYWPKEVSLQY